MCIACMCVTEREREREREMYKAQTTIIIAQLWKPRKTLSDVTKFPDTRFSNMCFPDAYFSDVHFPYARFSDAIFPDAQLNVVN